MLKNYAVKVVLVLVTFFALACGFAPNTYAQHEEGKSLGVEDCNITGAQVRLQPSDDIASELWVGVEMGSNDAVQQIPQFNPHGYEYVAKVYFQDNDAVMSWVDAGKDVLFYNWDGLVGYAHAGRAYVVSESRCSTESTSDALWTESYAYEKIGNIGVSQNGSTLTHSFFAGSTLSSQEQKALTNIPEGYLGQNVDEQGLVDGYVDGFDVIESTLQISPTGELLWSPQVGNFPMSTGITLPIGAEVLVITKFHACDATCPPAMIRSVVALEGSKVMSFWRDDPSLEFLIK